MQPAPEFTNIVSEKRKKLRLTQKELAEHCKISQTRINRLEVGRRSPTEAEIERIAESLDLCPTLLRTTRHRKSKEFRRIEKKFLTPNQLALQSSQPSLNLYRNLRHRFPKLTVELESQLQERTDANAIRVFLRDALCESEGQYLAYLRMLEAGAVVGRAAPQRIGLTHLPVVDPASSGMTGHLAYPALGLRHSIFIPQVTLKTTGGLVTLDLVWAERMGGQTFFRDIEITEAPLLPGREEAVGMKVLRYTTADVSGGHFLSAPWAA